MSFNYAPDSQLDIPMLSFRSLCINIYWHFGVFLFERLSILSLSSPISIAPFVFLCICCWSPLRINRKLRPLYCEWSEKKRRCVLNVRLNTCSLIMLIRWPFRYMSAYEYVCIFLLWLNRFLIMLLSSGGFWLHSIPIKRIHTSLHFRSEFHRVQFTLASYVNDLLKTSIRPYRTIDWTMDATFIARLIVRPCSCGKQIMPEDWDRLPLITN